jgi:hypothetical protein
MRQRWEVADFVRAMRRQIRFGVRSRALRNLLRAEFHGAAPEFDWGMRHPATDRHESMEALADSVAVRSFVFEAFPHMDCAAWRAYRQPAREPPEMNLPGTVSREAPEVHGVN